MRLPNTLTRSNGPAGGISGILGAPLVVIFLCGEASAILAQEGARDEDGLPQLCLALEDQAAIPESWELNAVASRRAGPPVFYRSNPSQLVVPGSSDFRIGLPGRRIVGIHVDAALQYVDLVDARTEAFVQMADGKLSRERPIEVASEMSISSAIHFRGKWYLLSRPGTDGYWVVQSYSSTGQHLKTAPPIAAGEGEMVLGAVGEYVTVISLASPHRFYRIPAHLDGDWIALDPPAFAGEAVGRTVALPPLPLGEYGLVTLVDQGSLGRTVRFLHPSPERIRDSRLDVPLSFVSVGPDRTIHGIRELGLRELVTYSWSLTEGLCPQANP